MSKSGKEVANVAWQRKINVIKWNPTKQPTLELVESVVTGFKVFKL